ncbi:hypothetical protein MJO55_28825 (plasmid) [Mycolicibacterium rufum]|uniref:Uncharacterized protein n=1 Tax=Mycolicibacterium rufum TaxID=318424 RepID=A0A9X2YFZ8_9MYCO|nr:hypothetical protein [Mycolicibacterium rufum]KGI65932.1 hypothetical protein EU78_27480 [Mycolicibacterium rufum]MCV7072006.1 hypothetical protein [Mycolicibacterium rufum]ULP39922.1 hypothetical protein MJO55_28825 [Mycolicibacterium rufum]
MPIAALECVEREINVVDGGIAYSAGAEDDDVLSLIRADAAGRQVTNSWARDDELVSTASVHNTCVALLIGKERAD